MVESPEGSPRVFKHLFVRPDGRQVAFVWSRGGTVTATLRTSRPARVAVEYQLDGTPSAPQALDGGALADLRLRDGEVRIIVFE